MNFDCTTNVIISTCKRIYYLPAYTYLFPNMSLGVRDTSHHDRILGSFYVHLLVIGEFFLRVSVAVQLLCMYVLCMARVIMIISGASYFNKATPNLWFYYVLVYAKELPFIIYTLFHAG